MVWVGAKFNAESRRRKKMMAKKNWFKKRKESEDDMEQEPGGSPTKKRKYEDRQEVQKDGKLEGGTSLLSSQVEWNSPQSPKTINASGTCQEVNCINMQTGSLSNTSSSMVPVGGNVGPGGEDSRGPDGWKNKKIKTKKNPSL